MTLAPPTTWQPRFIELAREARRARREADAQLAETPLTASTFELLHYLANHGRSQISLQLEMSISKAALSEAITNLERRGLVKRATPKDKRLRIVSITDRGRRALEEARQVLAVGE